MKRIRSDQAPSPGSGGLPPRRPRRHAPDLSRARLLGQFFGDAVDALPPVDFAQDVGGRNSAFGPDDRKVIENVGALEDDLLAVHLHGIEADLDRLLDQLFGHLLHAVAEQLGGARRRGASVPGLLDGGEQSIERISHRFGLSLFESDNAEQAFTHYDERSAAARFLRGFWGLHTVSLGSTVNCARRRPSQGPQAAREAKSACPSTPPASGSIRFSGCGIRPRTLNRPLNTPAMAFIEPFGFDPFAVRP